MSPANPFVATQLRQVIYYHLDNDLTQNALFAAGRLHALDPKNNDAAHLLALCHFRLGRIKAAYEYSRDKAIRGQHLGCAYVFAQSSLALEKYSDGITALERCKGLWSTRNHWSKRPQMVYEAIVLLTDLIQTSIQRRPDDTYQMRQRYTVCLESSGRPTAT